jgi:hypothetical protein
MAGASTLEFAKDETLRNSGAFDTGATANVVSTSLTDVMISPCPNLEGCKVGDIVKQ